MQCVNRVKLMCNYFSSSKLKATRDCEMHDKLMGCNTTRFLVAYLAAKNNKGTITRQKLSRGPWSMRVYDISPQNWEYRSGYEPVFGFGHCFRLNHCVLAHSIRIVWYKIRQTLENWHVDDWLSFLLIRQTQVFVLTFTHSKLANRSSIPCQQTKSIWRFPEFFFSRNHFFKFTRAKLCHLKNKHHSKIT